MSVISTEGMNLSSFRGVWTRTELWEPKGTLSNREENRRVMWFQSRGGTFIDLRIDEPETKPQNYKSFSGFINANLEENLLTWNRVIDFRPRGAPDVGKVAFISQNCLQEDGFLPGDDFTEIWEREEILDSDHNCSYELKHKINPNRKGFFVIIDNWFALSVDRKEFSYDGFTTIALLADVFDQPREVPPEAREFVFQYETIVGRTSDWTIQNALYPSRIGLSLVHDSESQFIQSLWNDFEWTLIEGASFKLKT